MKIFKITLVFCLVLSCGSSIKNKPIQSSKEIKKEISKALDNWHKAAAEANFNTYFKLMTNDGVFLGTDATENWQNKEFKAFSKPYFDKGKAWSFTSVERNIYIYKDQKMAWFDELLDTQMKLCRGSGVMKLDEGRWKIAHYVLSIAIPNENVSEVVKLKAISDSLYTKRLRGQDKVLIIND